MFADGKADVVAVRVTEGEMDAMVAVIGKLVRRVSGEVVVLWAAREDDAGDGAEEEEKREEEAVIDSNGMRRPEISEAAFAGLLVAFTFLLIFIPGFMCLWRIQPPQTFEMFDSNDVKKKMQ